MKNRKNNNTTYFNVILPIPLRKEFTYKTVSEISAAELTGKRVIVEFNRKRSVGFVVSGSLPPPQNKIKNIKPVLEILDDDPVFSSGMLDLCRWISSYYICGTGEILKLALPSLLLTKHKKYVIINDSIDNHTVTGDTEKNIYQFIKDFSPVRYSKIIETFGKNSEKIISSLKQRSVIDAVEHFKPEKKKKTLKGFKLRSPNHKETSGLNEKISSLIKEFSSSEKITLRSLKDKGYSPYTINKAVSSGLLEEIRVEIDSVSEIMKENVSSEKFLLSPEQNSISEKIKRSAESKTSSVFLLHGVTGSGKTVIYIDIIKHVLEKGKSALVLVPEISLTPQTVRKFRSVFGDRIAVLHSRLSKKEKYFSWDEIRKNKYSVVIGPRSALFAPLKDPGVIIVDEEHDNSYKQTSSAPRYNARDSAVMRGYLEQIPVVLGSATPSLESYYNAVTGKYKLLDMKQRYGKAVMPLVSIVNRKDHYSIFEKSVTEEFSRILKSGRKIIVLQNRRGYSTHIFCPECGNVENCPNCSVSLTYHLSFKKLICHHCGYYRKSSDKCPECGSINMVSRGIGTEQVETELKRIFPDNPVFRMDKDTTSGKHAHSEILDAFSASGPGFLVGTQMVSKGLDFPDIGTVCIVNIDNELMFPDFRSDERAFQLIVQVSGRAGRSRLKGNVIIQTSNPQNQVILFASTNDHKGFYDYESSIRELTSYPPFSKLAKIIITSKYKDELKKYSKELYHTLSKLNKYCKIYEPVDRMVVKVNNIFRLYILIKSSIINDRNGKRLRNLVTEAIKDIKSSSKVKTAVDIDPSDLM